MGLVKSFPTWDRDPARSPKSPAATKPHSSRQPPRSFRNRREPDVWVHSIRHGSRRTIVQFPTAQGRALWNDVQPWYTSLKFCLFRIGRTPCEMGCQNYHTTDRGLPTGNRRENPKKVAVVKGFTKSLGRLRSPDRQAVTHVDGHRPQGAGRNRQEHRTKAPRIGDRAQQRGSGDHPQVHHHQGER